MLNTKVWVNDNGCRVVGLIVEGEGDRVFIQPNLAPQLVIPCKISDKGILWGELSSETSKLIDRVYQLAEELSGVNDRAIKAVCRRYAFWIQSFHCTDENLEEMLEYLTDYKIRFISQSNQEMYQVAV